jgi:hypothetical protein
MNRSSRDQNEHKVESGKKAYKRPRVQIYGDLRKITQTVGNMGAGDGGGGATSKTSP